jgi:hypothetical protein
LPPGARHFAVLASVWLCVALPLVVSADAARESGRAARGVPRLYSGKSPFNQPIPPNAKIDPRSDAYVAGLAEAGRRHGLFVSVARWTVPVYYATASSPRVDVRLTASWRVADWMLRVPIPRGAAPDPSSDGHMTILDRARGCEFDLYRARRENARWVADWANSIRTSSRGVYPFSFSARGSGFASLAGLIWPKELRARSIRHALLFSYPNTAARGAVSPATETDGQSARSDALPEGTRLQLDPHLDLRALGLSGAALTIGGALQRYGMYLGDTGGGVSLYAVNRRSYARDPYSGLFDAGPYASLERIPLNRFRVIRLPRVRPASELRSRARLVQSGCARMR